jgi:hypothetical protein
VLSLIGREQSKAIIEKYDKQYLFPMLFKCHYHLHPSATTKRGIVDQGVEKDKSLNIFELTTSASEPTT